MAATLVLAIAAHRKIGVMRQGREHVQRLARRRHGHLGAILARDRGPLRVGLGAEAELHGGQSGREYRVPNVVPVEAREILFRHAARRPTYRAEARAFALRSGLPEPHDSYRHRRFSRYTSVTAGDSTCSWLRR